MAQNPILVLHAGSGSACEVKYIINIVHALQESGYKVNLLTTNSQLKYFHDVPHELVYPWVPRTIFGYCQRFCMITRSLVLSIYTCWNTRNCKPSLIICDGSPLVIPVLKYFNHQVSFVNFMISFQNLVTKIKSTKETSLEHSCLLRADDIIFLSEESAALLEDEDEKRKQILPPIIDYLQYPSTVTLPKRENVFLVLGDFSDPDQINIVLEAYIQLRDMLGLSLWKNTYLIILGCCGDDSRKVKKSICNQETEIRVRVQVYEANDISIVRSCAAKCLAVLDVIKNTLWHAPLLTCMLAACPIVCLEDNHYKRLIQNEETGLVIKNQTHAIRNCMHRLIKNSQWTSQLGQRAALQVRNEFSRCMFRERLENIVLRHSIVKYYSPLPICSMKNLRVHWTESNRSNYDYKICEN